MKSNLDQNIFCCVLSPVFPCIKHSHADVTGKVFYLFDLFSLKKICWIFLSTSTCWKSGISDRSTAELSCFKLWVILGWSCEHYTVQFNFKLDKKSCVLMKSLCCQDRWPSQTKISCYLIMSTSSIKKGETDLIWCCGPNTCLNEWKSITPCGSVQTKHTFRHSSQDGYWYFITDVFWMFVFLDFGTCRLCL